MNKRFVIISFAAILFSAIIITIFTINKESISSRYGKSLRQNNLVNTVKLHELGITGQRIKIGLLDSGFELNHPAFSNINVAGRFDFANNDTIVSDEGKESLEGHGSAVLSVVGGYYDGELIGIAYESEFYLAKAEVPFIETYKEEFIAVSGMKWLDSSGVDIITNSLKFGKFEDRDYYHPNQMNGKTALITRAADSLVNRGILFCTSVGNSFENDWHIVEPPGDGFNVIAVGSIDKYRNVSFFSSCGPTTDGRIKPELAAPGEAVYFANVDKTQPQFWYSHGTSLSSPIVAGISALILSCHPNLTSEEVKEALLATSNNSDHPDNRIGWGIPDAVKAVTYFGPAFSNTPDVTLDDSILKVTTYCVSSLGIVDETVELHYSGDSENYSPVQMDREDENEYSAAFPIETAGNVYFYFTALDSSNQTTTYPPPEYGHHFIYSLQEKGLQELKFNLRPHTNK